MPVVKTKQVVDDLARGDALEVVVTGSGSMSDIDGWASGIAGVELLGQETRDEDEYQSSRTSSQQRQLQQFTNVS